MHIQERSNIIIEGMLYPKVGIGSKWQLEMQFLFHEEAGPMPIL